MSGKQENQFTGYPSIDKPWLKYYSEEEQNYHIPEMKIVDYMYQCTKNYSSEIAIEYMKQKVSYGELRANIDRTACALKELGIAEGDMVSVCMPNTPEVVYLFYAINKVGATANMLDPRNSNADFLRLMQDVGTTWLFVMDTAAEKFSEVILQAGLKGVVALSVLETFPVLIQKIVLRKEASLRADLSALKACRLLKWRDFLKMGKGKPTVPTAPYRTDAPAVICYTGGSTGVPKGAVMSDYNFNAYTTGVVRLGFDFEPGDRALVVAPPWVMYGISNSINAYLCMGLRLLLYPKSSLAEMGQQIIESRSNHVVAVPSSLKGLMNYEPAATADLSFIKTLILGAEKLDEAFETEANQWLADHGCRVKITKGYGMTELGAAVCYTKGASNLPNTVGVPYITDTVSVFNEKDGVFTEGRYGEQGEICVQSPKSMLGYAGTGAEQNSVILKRHQDGSVWVHTGDMGHMDENGCLYIDGRIKRMFVRDGYKVFPAAIEQVIARHANVKECAVVSAKDATLGYVAKAFLVLRNASGQEETIREVRSSCQESLYSYEVPEFYEVIDKLPLTNVGKVDYQKLEKMTDGNKS